jgi:hypothetical protein
LTKALPSKLRISGWNITASFLQAMKHATAQTAKAAALLTVFDFMNAHL